MELLLRIQNPQLGDCHLTPERNTHSAANPTLEIPLLVPQRFKVQGQIIAHANICPWTIGTPFHWMVFLKKKVGVIPPPQRFSSRPETTDKMYIPSTYEGFHPRSSVPYLLRQRTEDIAAFQRLQRPCPVPCRHLHRTVPGRQRRPGLASRVGL